MNRYDARSRFGRVRDPRVAGWRNSFLLKPEGCPRDVPPKAFREAQFNLNGYVFIGSKSLGEMRELLFRRKYLRRNSKKYPMGIVVPVHKLKAPYLKVREGNDGTFVSVNDGEWMRVWS